MAAAVAAGGKNTQQQKTPATDVGCRCFVVYQKILLRTVDAVAGIAQAERERAERLAAEAAARNNDTENGKD